MSAYNYLLSSINQGLAALFALVFALMFTLTQLSINNKATKIQTCRIFSKPVFVYVVCFCIVILAPLFVIGTENQLTVKIILFFASCVIAMLIPFFWRFKVTTTTSKKSARSVANKK